MANVMLQIFPDGTSGINRFDCTYNTHVLQFYLYRMELAKKLKQRFRYEFYIKQINLEFIYKSIPLPYEIRIESTVIHRLALVPSETWC